VEDAEKGVTYDEEGASVVLAGNAVSILYVNFY